MSTSIFLKLCRKHPAVIQGLLAPYHPETLDIRTACSFRYVSEGTWHHVKYPCSNGMHIRRVPDTLFMGALIEGPTVAPHLTMTICGQVYLVSNEPELLYTPSQFGLVIPGTARAVPVGKHSTVVTWCMVDSENEVYLHTLLLGKPGENHMYAGTYPLGEYMEGGTSVPTVIKRVDAVHHVIVSNNDIPFIHPVSSTGVHITKAHVA